jgi:RNA polymerase sigma-70 factor (ECF subfamily)
LELVNAIKKGDQLIFSQVFTEYHEKLYSFILKKTQSEYLAEEVVQITFIKLWNNRESLNENYSISTQLYRIGTTTLIDLIRKRNTSEAIIKKLVEEKNVSPLSEVVDNLEVKDLSLSIEKALKSLPPTRRKVFKMSRFQEMSYSEIANELSISTKTVENHISLAIKQLRPFLFIILLIFMFSSHFNNQLLGVNALSKRNNQIKGSQF